MFKRVIILVVLSSILFSLVLVKNQTKSNGPSEYTMQEYKITKINGNQYYGKGQDGTGIHFSAEKIISGEKIQVHDVVICYFEKDNLGNGIVKVEQK